MWFELMSLQWQTFKHSAQPHQPQIDENGPTLFGNLKTSLENSKDKEMEAEWWKLAH